MRWIKQRSEALPQLRCIEVNDDWDEFISFVHDKTKEAGSTRTKDYLFEMLSACSTANLWTYLTSISQGRKWE
jgi:hypothetical protein